MKGVGLQNVKQHSYSPLDTCDSYPHLFAVLIHIQHCLMRQVTIKKCLFSN